MSSDKFKIEINGVEFETRSGQMIIEVTDAADIYVPRFCYHSKLSIAANCRMCLVEVEKAPKPLPACATPVADGMKIFTKSAAAIAAQKSVMEFLLINHPLDCPICDQGGECELQDIAMGYGRGISRFTEQKRVVQDKDLGPLISTDMTRCIHCTRCVRFGQEIAGIQELGTIGRGEDMLMGGQDDDKDKPMFDHEHGPYDVPVHSASVEPFFASCYEFTVGQWRLLDPSGPDMVDYVGERDHPMMNVSGEAMRHVAHAWEAARPWGYGPGDFPHAEALAKEVLCLPIHPFLSDTDQDRVLETLATLLR